MATKQKQYTLYIDESQTHDKFEQRPHFCMAGAIINDKEYSAMADAVNHLKRTIWNDYSYPEKIILHQKSIIDASKGKLNISKFPEYERFKSKGFRKNFYSEFARIFDCRKITIVGSSIDVEYMEKCYDIIKPRINGESIQFRNQTNKYLITLQLLLENFCHFLVTHNGKGRIVYESISEIDNERICSKFYQIKLMGSMYITKEAMHNHLLGINFVRKDDNNIGLQVADFIPNAFAREHARFNQFDKDDTLIRKMKFYRYGGQQNNQDRYGIKFMP